MRTAGLDEAQAGIKIVGRNINNLRYADDTTLMVESEEELKSFLMKVKEESEKVVLKLNVLKLIGKDSDARRDWGQEEKGMSEDEMAEWHHRLDVHGFGWTPGIGDGKGGLACCSPWGRKELDRTG